MNTTTPRIQSTVQNEFVEEVARAQFGPDAHVKYWGAEPIQKHGKHRVVRYTLGVYTPESNIENTIRWVGKYFEDNERVRDAARVLREVAAHLAGVPGVVVPRVLAYWEPKNLMLTSFESGSSVTTAIAHGDARVLPSIASAAASLHAAAARHATGAGDPEAAAPAGTPADRPSGGDPRRPPGGRNGPQAGERTEVKSVALLLSELETRVFELCRRLPEYRFVVESTMREIAQSRPSDSSRIASIHGDFGPANLLWQDGSVVLLDFDKSTAGDAAFDIGNFLTQLRRMTLRKPGRLPPIEEMRDTVLRAYAERAAGGAGTDFPERVAWFERYCMLRKACFLNSDAAHMRNRARAEEGVRLLNTLRDSR